MRTMTVFLIGLLGVTLMNYLEAKKELVDVSGHAELVTASATGDFSDHTVPERPKAKTILNKANRRLEDALVELKPEQVREISIIEGQYQINVPDLRYVSRIDLVDSDNKMARKQGLRRRTMNWMRENYRKPFGSIDNGCPRDWCRNSGPITEEFISNGAFDSSVDPWTMQYSSISQGSAPTLTSIGGKAVITFSAHSAIVNPRIRYSFNAYPYTDDPGLSSYPHETPIDISGTTLRYEHSDYLDPSYVRIYGAGRMIYLTGGGYVLDESTYFSILDQALLYNTDVGSPYTEDEIRESLAAAEYIEFGSAANGASGDPVLITFDNISIKPELGLCDLITLPPSDKTYKASVFGGYYAHDFSDDDDETWCSVNCPNALILMAQAYIELQIHNNRSGFADFEKQALKEAGETWANFVYEQITGRPIEEQRLGPLSFGSYGCDSRRDPNASGHYEWVDG